MDVALADETPGRIAGDALLLLLGGDEPLGPLAAQVDRECDGVVTAMRASGELRGTVGERRILATFGRIGCGRLVLVGLGDRATLDGYRLRNAVELAAREVRGWARTVVIAVEPTLLGAAGDPMADPADRLRAVVLGVGLGRHVEGELRTEPADRDAVERLVVVGLGTNPELATAAGEAAHLADATNRARTWQARPANLLTPTLMAAEAVAVAEASGLEHEVLGPDRLEALRMGALLGVARGSHEPPRLVVLRHRGVSAAGPVLALVGKGITFDSGGISLKPGSGMAAMKMDMSGGAAVIAAMGEIGRRRPDISVLGVVPMTENMPGGGALKPGDVVTAMNGRTVEVTNTDAEGRLVLADALWYATTLGATHLVDIATLTYSVGHAVGHPASGALSNDRALLDRLRRAAHLAVERVWEIPLYPEYDLVLESEIADLKNLSDIPEAGAMAGAIFLREFVGGRPWVHLDVGSAAWNLRRELAATVPSGPTGVMTRTFAQLPFQFGPGSG